MFRCPCLLIFAAFPVLLWAGNDSKQSRGQEAKTKDPADFAQLLADYRAFGLPLPPDNAKLVRFESGGRYILNSKLMPPTYFLGFLLRSATKENPALLLVGTQEMPFEKS